MPPGEVHQELCPGPMIPDVTRLPSFIVYSKDLKTKGTLTKDKKPSAMNWIEGRGKSIIAECLIPEATLKTILKVTPDQLERLNVQKNLIGSSVAGSVGGFNAHVATVVPACFLATGQDAAQVVEGSQTMTLLEKAGFYGP